ncbi:MAG: 6,7-dimethyl-8-ribityllumazine synthase [Chthoniobacteraceae bacterium]|nr:6,7-dimethyl-8-ribityllumazine synthase [Chthoniobacteraceae bacterium]
MSNIAPQRTRHPLTVRRSFTIVASQYNPEYVQGLVASVRRELEIISPRSTISVIEVPGAFEIPVVLQEVAARGEVDAIIALGVIIKGETAHADLIGRAITDSFQNIALRFRIPVIHEVLLVENEEQARERTLGEAHNRGVEAARAAMQVVEVMNEIKVD